MDKKLLEELDITIRACIRAMKKVDIFDSHAVLNYVYYEHRGLFDRLVRARNPVTREQWVSFRRNVYNRIKKSSSDMVELVPNEQSWSFVYDGSYGPSAYWRKIPKGKTSKKKDELKIV